MSGDNVIGIAGWQPPGLADQLGRLGYRRAELVVWELTWSAGGEQHSMTFPIPREAAENCSTQTVYVAPSAASLSMALAIWSAQWSGEGVELLRAERVNAP